MRELKEFTESDWESFAGAEKPGEGEPLIGEIEVDDNEGIIIVDAKGIYINCLDFCCCSSDSCEDVEGEWLFDCSFASGRAIAMLLPESISTEEDLVDLGFRQIF